MVLRQPNNTYSVVRADACGRHSRTVKIEILLSMCRAIIGRQDSYQGILVLFGRFCGSVLPVIVGERLCLLPSAMGCHEVRESGGRGQALQEGMQRAHPRGKGVGVEAVQIPLELSWLGLRLLVSFRRETHSLSRNPTRPTYMCVHSQCINR